MKINYAHLCDHAFLQNGKPSLIGVFDTIGVRDVPAKHKTWFLVFQLGLEPAEVGRSGKMLVQLRDPDGGELLRVEGEVSSKGTGRPGSRHTLNQVIPLPQVEFKVTGDHEFVFFVNGRLDFSLPLTVQKVEVPGG